MPRFFLASLLLLALSAARAEETASGTTRTLHAGVETQAAPYTFADQLGRPAGFSVELLKAVAGAQGLSVEFELLDWPALLAAFKAGRIDIICNVADTPGRQGFMQFSTTTTLMEGRLFQRRGTPAIKSAADLAGRKIALPRDSRAHEYIRRNDLGVEPVFCPTLADCVQAVHDGRADILISTRLVTVQFIRDRGYEDIAPSEWQFADFNYRQHFAVGNDQAELLAQLNEGLATVYRNGNMTACMKNGWGRWIRGNWSGAMCNLTCCP